MLWCAGLCRLILICSMFCMDVVGLMRIGAFYGNIHPNKLSLIEMNLSSIQIHLKNTKYNRVYVSNSVEMVMSTF